MKYFTGLILLILLTSCNQRSKKVVIRGIIYKPNTNYLLIISKNDTDTISIDNNNSFFLEMEIENPGYLTVADGKDKFTVFVANGYELFISKDNRESPGNIEFSGTGDDASNYLRMSSLLSSEINSRERELISMNETDFVFFMDSVRSYKDSVISTFVIKNEADHRFYKLEKSRILFEWALHMIQYQSGHMYHTNSEDFEVSANFYDFINEVPTSEYDFMELPEYVNLINIMVRRAAYKAYRNSSRYDIEYGYYYAKLNSIDSIISDSKIKKDLAYETVISLLKRKGPEGLDSMLSIYTGKYCNDGKSSEVELLVEKWNRISKGTKAPDFTNSDSTGRSYSLSDFRGNYIYIDVWASWCHPCVSKLESMKKLVNEYSDKNIVFLSVSVNTDHDEWKDMIIGKNLNWLQLISEDGWNTGIVNDYLIKSIPRYILIDPDGNIVSSRAPGPDLIGKKVFSNLWSKEIITDYNRSINYSGFAISYGLTWIPI